MTGMLWFDNDPKKTLDEKVARAAAYYQNKYAQAPNVCFVHPTQASQTTAAGLEIRSARNVLVNHFWMGVNLDATRADVSQ